MKVNIGEIGLYLRCRRAWSWGGESQRNLISQLAFSRPLWLGTGVHLALERFYSMRPAVDPADVFFQWVADWQAEGNVLIPKQREDVDLGGLMLRGYTREYGADPEDDAYGLRFLSYGEGDAAQRVVEQQFQVPIPDTEDGVLVGTADGLIRDANGLVWLIDHKTYSRPPFRAAFVLNHQFTAYTWAFQLLSNSGKLTPLGVQTGEPIEGVLYNGLRKQKPGPRVTEPLFMREWINLGHDTLVSFQDQLANIYREMTRPGLPLYPNPTGDCSRCEFLHPCTLKQGDDDYEGALRTAYVKRPPRGEVYEREPREDEG